MVDINAVVQLSIVIVVGLKVKHRTTVINPKRQVMYHEWSWIMAAQNFLHHIPAHAAQAGTFKQHHRYHQSKYLLLITVIGKATTTDTSTDSGAKFATNGGVEVLHFLKYIRVQSPFCNDEIEVLILIPFKEKIIPSIKKLGIVNSNSSSGDVFFKKRNKSFSSNGNIR
jgi:hypothetical protein